MKTRSNPQTRPTTRTKQSPGSRRRKGFVGARFPEAEHRQIKALARAEGLSVSALMRKALLEGRQTA